MIELSVGDSAKFSKTISESDVYLYAGITGDLNPAHIDKEYASGTIFNDRLCHGMLLAGLISGVLGTKLPGPGTIYINQTLTFLKPVYIGDTISAVVEITKIIKGKQAKVSTKCINQLGDIVLDGEALVSLPRDRSLKK